MGEGGKSTYIISNTHGFRILVYQPVNNISEKENSCHSFIHMLLAILIRLKQDEKA